MYNIISRVVITLDLLYVVNVLIHVFTGLVIEVKTKIKRPYGSSTFY